MPVSASLALLIAAAFVSGLWGGARGLFACLVLAAASVRWLLINPVLEGRVILRLNDHHGLVESDIAGFVGLAIAGGRLVYLSRGWLSRLRGRATNDVGVRGSRRP